MNHLFSFSRLFALLAKEMTQMMRDRITFGMMIGIPLVQLALFGFAINTDPKQLPAALVTTSQDQFTRAIVSALEVTNYYRFDYVGISAKDADELMLEGKVSFIVTIPADLSKRVLRGDEPQILIEADASDPSASSGAVSTLSTVAKQALTRALGTQSQQDSQLDIVVHRRYNPEGISQYNIVPGLLGVILQLVMVMMTAMALTREVERGTMENLLAMPATPFEIMLGKILPYLGVGAVQVIVILVAAKMVFHVPFVGSLALLISGILVFISSLVLIGYFISTVAGSQMQAMQMSFFFFLPSLMLSGFMFPFKGMPYWAQMIGEIFPLTHFLRLVRGVMLKGADLEAMRSPMLALMGFTIILVILSLARFRKTLD
ncbi:ABC-2 type transport system permease protein [Cohaesibacter marisflavi]|uniref:ABC-2 type transport system permease protein n=1 Tax=Cohaesibacter marisflavi TaxID=655353 RepID=A0A1I5H8D5_9HYPH|nr:ABC transporter permease [Cohaesibacter marisflavi]SFO44256.1 ABC-2 type transport system permease protein [Cohaesibacter marisflavi]